MARSAISFLDIPAEVRNMIYHHLFPEGRSSVQLLERNGNRGYIQMTDRLGVLSTCRQIYEEAKSVLHEPHRFTVVQPKTLQQLIQQLWMDGKDDQVYYDSDEGEAHDNHILQYLFPEGGICLDYDLDNRRLVKNLPALMYTERWLRDMCILNPAGARITALPRTISARSAFGDFQTLQAWVKDEHANPTRWEESFDFKTKIILAFDSSAWRHSDLEIDATALLCATRGLRKPGLVRIEVKTWASWEIPPCTVGGLQARVLLFMWHLIRNYPETRRSLCPTIWLNGELWPVKADFNDNKLRTICDSWMSPYNDRTALAGTVEHVAEILRRMGDPDNSGAEIDSNSETDMDFVFDMDFDMASLFGVAADLAQLIHDNENII